MGIKQLMQLINDKAPAAVRRIPIENYAGRTIACDASMAIYQFLIATQFATAGAKGISMLTDESGNPTAHLVGLFNRTVQFLEHGIKPVWVFDGVAPLLKGGVLEKRKKAKVEAEEALQVAIEEGNLEEAKRYSKRSVRITPEMTEDAKHLIRLLGVPVVEAPGEAEAQCAKMVTQGQAYAVASEDMDSLTFGAAFLLKGFNNKKEPIVEVSLEEVLRSLNLTQNEFIDMCILLGSDYTTHVDGIGPANGYKLIQQYSSLERVIEFVNSSEKKRFKVPAEFNYPVARELFHNPNVLEPTCIRLDWTPPDEPNLKAFLIEGRGFAEGRVESGLRKLKNSVGKPLQMRLENFFGQPQVKRKATEPATKSGKKPKLSRR
jgi:flap endonuclease-1